MRKPWMQMLIVSGFLLSGCSETEPATAEQLSTDVILHTQMGDVSIHLYDDTPIHRENFLRLAGEGFFDSLTFHRVLHNFVVQAGDPRSRYGTWSDSVMGPGYDLEPELTEHHVHVRGALAMARKPDEENPERRSAGSQFYFVTGTIVLPAMLDSMENVGTRIRKGKAFNQFNLEKEQGTFSGSYNDYLAQHPVSDFHYTPEQKKRYLEVGGAPLLDFTYTVFGEVTSGMETVMQISRQPATEEGQLLNEVRIDSVSIPDNPVTSQTSSAP